MGVVYRATDSKLGRNVAIKILSPKTLADEAARSRFRQEARALSSLNHPNICTIYEAHQEGEQAFLAMEYVEGRPLSSVISAGPLPLQTVFRYGVQIADALAHAHARGIVHRDLKSANVMVTPEGRIKVLDFGLARQVTRTEIDETTLSQVTAVGTVVGTLHYLPPEALRGEPADARGDIWALGVVLHEMCSAEFAIPRPHRVRSQRGDSEGSAGAAAHRRSTSSANGDPALPVEVPGRALSASRGGASRPRNTAVRRARRQFPTLPPAYVAGYSRGSRSRDPCGRRFPGAQLDLRAQGQGSSSSAAL